MKILINEEIKQGDNIQKTQIDIKDLMNQNLEQTPIQYFRPKLLNQYLKQYKVLKATDLMLKQLNFEEHKLSIEHSIHQENINLKNYDKLIKHLIKLEYHFFDHNWFPNINYLESTNIVDSRELNFIQGRSERTLQNMHPGNFKTKLPHKHVKFYLEHL